MDMPSPRAGASGDGKPDIAFCCWKCTPNQAHSPSG